MTGKPLLALLAAGWLAEALASTHSDIEAGITAHNAGDHDAALTAYAAAEADLGERPEIYLNKGLALLAKGDTEGARKAFEHGTESEHAAVHASAEYELGNLELDAEQFDAAIERYKKCLILKPEHASAKWNLELALLKKKQKEDEEKKKEEEKDKNEDEEKKDDEDKDEQKDEEKKDDEKKDEQDEQKDEEKKDEQDEKKDEEKKDEQKQDEQKQDEQKQDEQKQDEPKPGEEQQQQPQPLDKADLDKALEQLDAEDRFQLGRPLGRQVPVERDW